MKWVSVNGAVTAALGVVLGWAGVELLKELRPGGANVRFITARMTSWREAPTTNDVLGRGQTVIVVGRFKLFNESEHSANQCEVAMNEDRKVLELDPHSSLLTRITAKLGRGPHAVAPLTSAVFGIPPRDSATVTLREGFFRDLDYNGTEVRFYRVQCDNYVSGIKVERPWHVDGPPRDSIIYGRPGD